MVATIYRPGDPRFRYLVGTMDECTEWLKAQVADPQYPRPIASRITSNKKAARWRYQGGTPVIPEIDERRDIP